MDKKIWDVSQVQRELQMAFANNSHKELLRILKNNTFLFYFLYSRKKGMQPIFTDLEFGRGYKCDFVWLNDNAYGPEWVLMNIGNPMMNILNDDGSASDELNRATDEIKLWRRFFLDNPKEKRELFSAVSRFRFILVAGEARNWITMQAIKCRTYHKSMSKIEIRSTAVFERAVDYFLEDTSAFSGFIENPLVHESSAFYDFRDHNRYLVEMGKFF